MKIIDAITKVSVAIIVTIIAISMLAGLSFTILAYI